MQPNPITSKLQQANACILDAEMGLMQEGRPDIQNKLTRIQSSLVDVMREYDPTLWRPGQKE